MYTAKSPTTVEVTVRYSDGTAMRYEFLSPYLETKTDRDVELIHHESLLMPVKSFLAKQRFTLSITASELTMNTKPDHKRIFKL